MTNSKGTSTWFAEVPPATPGVVSPPSTLALDNTATTGLTISYGTSPPAQPAIEVVSSAGLVVFQVLSGAVQFQGTRVGVLNSTLAAATSIDGTQTKPPLMLQDGVSGTTTMQTWAGAGAPSATTVGTAQVGDRYHRSDGAAGTYVYVCTVAGTPGTWTGIA